MLLRMSLATLIAVLFSAPAPAADTASPADHAWKTWILAPPPEPPFTDIPLKEKLVGLPASQKSEAARFMFDTWSTDRYVELYELLEAMGMSLPELVARWAERDFEAVFRRVEEWEGFGENQMRGALVRQMAAKNPVAAARFMSERLNPMSKQYYYYVLIYGLVPSLADKPISVIHPALGAIASGDVSTSRAAARPRSSLARLRRTRRNRGLPNRMV